MRECLRLAVVGAVGFTGLTLCRRHVEQLPRSRDVIGAPAVGEETVVADAMEAARQDGDEGTAEEFVHWEGHQLCPFPPPPPGVLPPVVSYRNTQRARA